MSELMENKLQIIQLISDWKMFKMKFVRKSGFSDLMKNFKEVKKNFNFHLMKFLISFFQKILTLI